MKIFWGIIITILFSISALSYKARMGCTSGKYICNDSFCGWVVTPYPLDPKIIELSQTNAFNKEFWSGSSAEKVNGLDAQLFVGAVIPEDGSVPSLVNSYATLTKNGLTAESYAGYIDTGYSVTVSLRDQESGDMYSCTNIEIIK